MEWRPYLLHPSFRGVHTTLASRCWQVCQGSAELGSLAAALGGLDALVFTAGIGENAPLIRARVCRAAAWFGIELDESANDLGGPRISRQGSRASAWVLPTDEELMIALHTRAALAVAV